MSLSVGIIGLPNVGKSTLFNALLKKQAALVANYPFATIEPNVGVVPVPDQRLDKLAEIEKEENQMVNFPPKVYATVKFVDIAGLVKGAHEGAGLGNKFLSHIREVDVICHVVRAFSDESVVKEGSVDPKTDYETIKTELILADLQTLSKVSDKSLKLDPLKKTAVEKLFNNLNQEKSAIETVLTPEEKEATRDLFLLSFKSQIIVLNVSEDDYTKEKSPELVNQYAGLMGLPTENFIVVSAKIESELAALSNEEQKEYLKGLGLEESGLERLIKKAYQTLGLISFLTAGEKEVRAWTIKRGANAQNAAGVIHTDFIKNFIKAEVVSFEDFVQYRGWEKARELGKSRFEGRDYLVRDGNVIEFKIGL